jgi:HEAT repeat protein
VLYTLGEPALAEVCTAAIRPEHEDVRMAAARTLSHTPGPVARGCLLDALRHSDPGVRATAAAALHGFVWAQARTKAMPPEEAFALVAAAAADADPSVRVASLDAFTLFDPATGARAVKPLADDPDPAVREKADGVLASIDKLTAIEKMRNLGKPQ